MLDEIRQNGKTVLSGEDGFSIPMFFNNLCGKNFSGEKYRDYIRYIAFGEMGFKPGEITLYRNGVQVRTGKINIEGSVSSSVSGAGPSDSLDMQI